MWQIAGRLDPIGEQLDRLLRTPEPGQLGCAYDRLGLSRGRTGVADRRRGLRRGATTNHGRTRPRRSAAPSSRSWTCSQLVAPESLAANSVQRRGKLGRLDGQDNVRAVPGERCGHCHGATEETEHQKVQDSLSGARLARAPTMDNEARVLRAKSLATTARRDSRVRCAIVGSMDRWSLR